MSVLLEGEFIANYASSGMWRTHESDAEIDVGQMIEECPLIFWQGVTCQVSKSLTTEQLDLALGLFSLSKYRNRLIACRDAIYV